ncbi:hypothetical protein [Peteryoungia algae]|uniref:Uncharacterized protein n=1 Tax=Peteryoungia algae TaxID=2919917 RepID=A0ABT0D1W3_9HYPH|nr:hypothetical protein [Rhizobium sp. SSM4.3]MCJ8239279.1 hypothetical protein [Rhizobium sp. SSM4.3]
MKRFWHAVRDVVVGLKVDEDSPVAKYKVELEHASERLKKDRERELHLLEFKAKNFIAARQTAVERTVRRLKAAHSHSTAVVERVEKELEEKYSLKTVARAEREKAQAQFEKWQKAVGRPPYRTEHRSLIDRLRLTLEPLPSSDGGITSMASTIDTNGSPPRTRSFISIAAGIIGLVVIPMDVIYALPGFRVILEDPFFAQIAAVILGLMLIFLGGTLAYLIPRAYSHSVDDAGNIAGKFNKVPLALFIVIAMLGLATIYGATTIRSIVPEANAALAEQSSINMEVSSLRSRPLGSTTLEDRREEIVRLEGANSGLVDRMAELRVVNTPRLSADALIAMCFYALGVLSVMISRSAHRDPVFEYELAALSYGGALGAEVEIANSIQSGRAKAEALLAELNVNIEDQEKELGDVQLDEARKASIEDKKLEIEALEADDRAKIKRETLEYAKYLRLLTRSPRPLREWEELYGEGKTESPKPVIAAVAV